MKKEFLLCLTIIAGIAAYSCNDDTPGGSAIPQNQPQKDLGFGQRGVVTVTALDNTATLEHFITVQRLYEPEKEITVNLAVDPALIASYNSENGTSYKEMSSTYYTVPSGVTLAPGELTAKVDVTLKPQALVAAVGAANAADYVIPLKILSVSPDIAADISKAYALINLNPASATITLDKNQAYALSFISTVKEAQNIAVGYSTNFGNPNFTEITWTADEADVETYNAANGTDYKLLPEAAYAVRAGEFNASQNTGAFDLEVMGWQTDAAYDYLLPLKAVSANYAVSQEAPVYLIVDVTQIHVNGRMADGIKGNGVTPLSQTVMFELERRISEDVTVKLSYDPAAVADYNAANGTNYLTLPSDKVILGNTQIDTGQTSATVVVTVDGKEAVYTEWDTDPVYLILVGVDESTLPQGVKPGEPAAFTFKRTLFGHYEITVPPGGNDNYMNGPVYSNIRFLKNEYPYCNRYYTWDEGFQWKVEWEQDFEGDPKKKPITPFSSVLGGDWRSDADILNQDVHENASYLDTETGIVYFKFKYYYNQDDKTNNNPQWLDCYISGYEPEYR